MSEIVVVTDNAFLARHEFPGARLMTRTADVLALPDGARVVIRAYRVGALPDDAVLAAQALAARGVLAAG